MRLVRADSPARAGLVGNPSDGFGGATLGLALANFKARVVVYEWPRLEVLPGEGDRCSFPTLADFRQDLAANGYEGGMRLVKAAIARFATLCETLGREPARSFSVRYESDIPRQVGLAGSSAIVTATLKALAAYHELQLQPTELAALALAVESEELGIAAGPQDRVLQALGGLLYMDFDPALAEPHEHEHRHGQGHGPGHGRYERLDPSLLPPMYVAYRRDAAQASNVVHSDLRARHAAGEPAVLTAMQRLRELASKARRHLCTHDHQAFADCIDAGFEQRRAIITLDPRQEAMVDLARSLGASATFAGSGGAIIGTCDGPEMRARLGEAFAAQGCRVIAPRVGQAGT